MDQLNILVLHTLGNPSLAPNFLHHYIFSLKASHPAHNYLYHDTTLPLPSYVRDTVFDAIILDVSFLCARWASPEFFAQTLDSYRFVKYSDSVKIAFPQDEYDCSELLDNWLCDWNVDYVFSVISSGWDILYPRFHKTGNIRLGYTGYIDQNLVNVKQRPFIDRPIDIGYRARKLPPYFGRIGQTKWTIGRDVARLGKDANLHNDIIVGSGGTLYGSAWTEFINSSKFTLGANSGSSLLDPRGDIQRRVKAYVKNFPEATFEEVEGHCFKGLDGLHSFTAISPRVLEAALLGSCQILVDGEYSGVIQPWTHYIPIRADASNFPEVVAAMRDQAEVQRRIKNCREAILDRRELRYVDKDDRTIRLISEAAPRKRVVSSCAKVRKVLDRYNTEMPRKYQKHWQKAARRRKLVGLLEKQPLTLRIARSTHNLLKNLRGG